MISFKNNYIVFYNCLIQMEFFLRILILEDSPEDAEVIRDIIVNAGMRCHFYLAIDKDSFLRGIAEFSPDVILSDNALPQFDSEEALQITRRAFPDIPFILVTGTVSEEYAVKITKNGADDYILKDRLARLPAAIDAALHYRRAQLENKQANEHLVESEAKYRTLISRITDAFIALDEQWNYTYANQQACDLVHRKQEELIGRNVWDLFPGAVGSATYLAFHDAMKTQHFICIQDYYAPLDLWQENHIYPSKEGLSVFVRDITLSKRAEQKIKETFAENEELAARLSAILNTLPANIALLDNQGVIIDVNDAWSRFAIENGYALPGYGKGENYITISNQACGNDEKDGKTVAVGIKAVRDGQINEFVFEYACHSADQKRWFRMIVTPLSEKIFSGMVVMHIDISEIKRLEQERLHSKVEEQKKITKAILEAQENERNLIGSELHDNVNQILAGIKLILSTARINPAKTGEVIDNAISNVQYAIDENRKIAHELVAPDFKEIKIAEQLTLLIEGMLKKGGIEITIESNGFSEELLDDEQKLAIYRVAQEQCTNILKHSGATAVNISLNISGNLFEMNIADNGRGMEKGKLIKGIGLKNIRSRVDLYNGTVHIVTAPGKGFMMKVSLPVH